MQYQQLMQEFSPTRRRLLLGSALATLAAAAGHRAYAAQATQSLRHLVAKHGSAQLAPTPYPQTAIWGYNGSVPGPELRLRQGERLRVADRGLREGILTTLMLEDGVWRQSRRRRRPPIS